MKHVRAARPDLAGLRRFLADLSGIKRLERHLRHCLLDEADVLKADTALGRLRWAAAAAEREGGVDAAAGLMIQHAVRQLQDRLGTHVDEVQVRHVLEYRPTVFGLSPKDRAAARRLLGRGPAHKRLGRGAGCDPDVLRRTCLTELHHWRVVANDGTRLGTAEWAAFVVLRACETVLRLLDEDRPNRLEGPS